MLELAADARRRGDAFVLATVVWRRGPSSGKQGYKALVFPDGAVVGWLGGACAEPTVVREAKQALQDGHPRLMFLGPADELDGRSREGVVSVPMACESEGALEVYLEPVLPAPHVVVIGRSPAVGTLVSLARVLGWRATVVDDEDGPAHHPDGIVVRTALDLTGLDVGPRTAVVVATQGHYDEQALAAARRPTPATSAWWRRADGPRPCSETCASVGRHRRRSSGCVRRQDSTWARSSTTRSHSPSWPSWSAARRPASCAPASPPPGGGGDRPGLRHGGRRPLRSVPRGAWGKRLPLLCGRVPAPLRGRPRKVPRRAASR